MLGFQGYPIFSHSYSKMRFDHCRVNIIRICFQPSFSRHASPGQPFTNMPTLLPWHQENMGAWHCLSWIVSDSSCTLENHPGTTKHHKTWFLNMMLYDLPAETQYFSVSCFLMFPFTWPSESSNPYPGPAAAKPLCKWPMKCHCTSAGISGLFSISSCT